MKRIAALALAVIAVLVVAVVAFLALFDWNLARGRIEQAMSERLGRPVEIGYLDVDVGWRSVVTVEQARIGNPKWAKRPNLLEVQRAVAVISTPALLSGAVDIESLELTQPFVALERRDGQATWDLNKDKKKEDNPDRAPRVGRVRIDRGTLELIDPAKKTELSLQIAASGTQTKEDLKVSGRGSYRGAPFSLDASGPGALLLNDATQPYPFKGNVRAGATTARLAGTVTEPAALREVNVEVEMRGDDLAKLRDYLGITLAPTPPYQVRGRVLRKGGRWEVEGIEGKVGESDISGRVAFTPASHRDGKTTRPLLSADVVSNRLDFDDLGPLIGAPPRTTHGEAASPQQKREAERLKQRGQAFPDKPFDLERWQKMDVDASLVGRKVLHPPALPIDSLEGRLYIREGILRVTPLRAKLAQGQMSAQIELDGRQSPLKGSAEIDFRGLRLNEMFPTVEAMKNSRGVAHGKARLAGTGNSVAALMHTADGRVTLAVEKGIVSNLVLELIGLDIAESVLLFATRDREVPLRCAVLDLDVDDGIATTEAMVIDTADTLVIGAGAISLRDEALNLTVYPQPKDKSLLSVRAPLEIRGSFRDPQVRPDAGELAKRGVGAVLLSLANPLLALASFIETGPGKDSDCGKLIAQARGWKAGEGTGDQGGGRGAKAADAGNGKRPGASNGRR